ncbi:hypothetical protein D3C73_1319230 [compost metagenome]
MSDLLFQICINNLEARFQVQLIAGHFADQQAVYLFLQQSSCRKQLLCQYGEFQRRDLLVFLDPGTGQQRAQHVEIFLNLDLFALQIGAVIAPGHVEIMIDAGFG